ncbi:major facilitator superfamily MFS_1 [Alkaliphilus metalliredigens QYMF]|uniref:Major facilitator superfamily MFS_1 n=1 Tax=Alkaliphilus metalliredigens (strain QYMF) TaxID=293826 RepID=A6TPF0_ALKMQ|nr:MFS transporter [Alkaliphilus metalliredigens]ABR48068.1 major facilitator superfamily MFS_1 [Alkaliphilus metalliredigens QYMF]
MNIKKKKKILNTNFVLFLLGRMISDLGNSVQMMIMPLYIIDIGGSAATIGLFAFLSLLPALIIYPFAGVIGDRMNRKKIMVVTDLISAGVILALGFISYWGFMNISLLLIVQAVISLLNGLFEPATRGMLPQLVDKEELTQSNSTVASMRSISIMLGPVIGTVLYANFGITMVFLINGISFLLSGASEMMIRYVHVKRQRTEGMKGIIKDLLEGIQFIMKNKIIRNMCYFFLVIYFVAQPIFSVILPLFFKTNLQYSDTQYGYLQTVIILGALLGSVVIGVLFGKEEQVTKPFTIGCGLLLGTMLIFSILLFPKSLAVLGNGTIGYLALLAGVLGLFSFANIFISVPVQTYIQRETPNEYMSRVFSLVSMISRGGMPLGALVYGIVLEWVEMHWTVLVATLLMMMICIVFISLLIKDYKIQEPY